MRYDVAIIGGGPAGLNAALVLGRARKTVAIFDNAQPRNRVTHASHGFITRDGVKPAEFRRIAYEEVLGYPTVKHLEIAVTDIRRSEDGFVIYTSAGEEVQAGKIILSGGLREQLPEIKDIKDYYGKSLFACPFCDGWELRDQALVIISDQPHAFHKVKLLQNWSRDCIVCTNGTAAALDAEQREQLAARGLPLSIRQSRLCPAKTACWSGFILRTVLQLNAAGASLIRLRFQTSTLERH